ncbi:hypothetical protein [Streptomyces sp. NPDC000994]
MAEGLELADEGLGLADGVDQALVMVGPEVFEAGGGIVDDVPDDHQHRPGHRDDGPSSKTSHSLKAGPPLPSQESIHDSAYEKIFDGEALEPTAGEGAWTAEETAAVRALLRAGLDLWEQAVHGSSTG